MYVAAKQHRLAAGDVLSSCLEFHRDRDNAEIHVDVRHPPGPAKLRTELMAARSSSESRWGNLCGKPFINFPEGSVQRTPDRFVVKPDIWLAPHNEPCDFVGKRQRAVTQGVNAWVDAEGYRLFVAGQWQKMEAEVNKELGVTVKTQ